MSRASGGANGWLSTQAVSNNPELRLTNGIRRSQALKTGRDTVSLVHGVDNLDNYDFLNNNEKFKTVLLNGYLTKQQSVSQVSRRDKRTLSDVGRVLQVMQRTG